MQNEKEQFERDIRNQLYRALLPEGSPAAQDPPTLGFLVSTVIERSNCLRLTSRNLGLGKTLPPNLNVIPARARACAGAKATADLLMQHVDDEGSEPEELLTRYQNAYETLSALRQKIGATDNHDLFSRVDSALRDWEKDLEKIEVQQCRINQLESRVKKASEAQDKLETLYEGINNPGHTASPNPGDYDMEFHKAFSTIELTAFHSGIVNQLTKNLDVSVHGLVAQVALLQRQGSRLMDLFKLLDVDKYKEATAQIRWLQDRSEGVSGGSEDAKSDELTKVFDALPEDLKQSVLLAGMGHYIDTFNRGEE